MVRVPTGISSRQMMAMLEPLTQTDTCPDIWLTAETSPQCGVLFFCFGKSYDPRHETTRVITMGSASLRFGDETAAIAPQSTKRGLSHLVRRAVVDSEWPRCLLSFSGKSDFRSVSRSPPPLEKTLDELFDARENAMTAPPEVVQLAERFDKFADAYVQGTYNETQVRNEGGEPLLRGSGLGRELITL